jgi:hypothetical protein
MSQNSKSPFIEIPLRGIKTIPVVGERFTFRAPKVQLEEGRIQIGRIRYRDYEGCVVSVTKENRTCYCKLVMTGDNLYHGHTVIVISFLLRKTIKGWTDVVEQVQEVILSKKDRDFLQECGIKW